MMKKNLKPVVLKLGGSSLGLFGNRDQGGFTAHQESVVRLASLIRKLHAQAFDVVLVHGGGPAINEELLRRGIEWSFTQGQRKTTAPMMEIIDDVLSNKVNGQLVQSLLDNNISATGLSGAKDRLLNCEQSDASLGWVGKVVDVDVKKIASVFTQKQNIVPVIAPVGIGSKDQLYNINADWAAAKIAIALQAEQLIFLTDQVGILDAQKRLISSASPEDLLLLINSGVINGGMCTKVRAMIEALERGILQVRVTHAESADDLTGSLLTRTKKLRKTKMLDRQEIDGKGRLYG